MKKILDSLHLITGAASTINDTKANVLTTSGWHTICDKFHRNHPETWRRCRESARKIAEHLQPGTYVGHKCLNGLYDYACPIIVENQHTATFLFGQVFHEPPDEEYFRSQARIYGFDEEAYIEALHEIPIMEEAKIAKIISFYAEFATIMADLGIQKNELSNTLDLLQQLMDSIPNPIFYKNSRGVYLGCNNAFETFTRATKETIIGHTAREFFPADTVKLLDDTDIATLQKNEIQRYEYETLDSAGAPCYVLTTKAPFFDDSGIVSGTVGVIIDITDRKAAEQALQQAHDELELKVEQRTEELSAMNEELLRANAELQKEIAERQRVELELTQAIADLKAMQTHLIQSEKLAALGSLVAGVAHEINTPVGVGVTAASHLQQLTEQFLHLCQHGTPVRQDMTKYLENLQEASTIILRNLERAGRLIKSFKQVSVDQSSETYRTFYVKKYLEEILLSMNPKLKRTKHRITVAINCDEALCINGYPGAFAQIITNLIMNSLSHAYNQDAKGCIRIAARQEKDAIVLHYTDDGKGMDSHVLTRIFDPFFTTKRGSGGTGLGLYVVYNIITQQFGGTIECTSAPGQGAAFRIWLPVGRGVNNAQC
jgi:PAS domain S-box-containing protein